MAEDSFIFYRSFRDAISVMPPEQQLETLLAICDYALDGTEPDLSGAPYAIFTIAKPVIRSNVEKRKNGRKGGRPKKETSGFDDTETSGFEETESNYNVNVNENVNNPLKPPKGASASFSRFWEAYPKKVGKQAAEKAFRRVNVPLETLLTAIERQKRGDRWSRENGRYIPNPATWLNQGRWEDEESDVPPPEPETERRGWL